MAKYLQEITNDTVCPVEAKEELLDECERIWKLLEQCQSQTMLLGTETLLKSSAKTSLLKTRVRSLTAECRQWQDGCPELVSTNPDVLIKLGKIEFFQPWKKDQIKNVFGVALQYVDWTLLQKVENDLRMVLSTVKSKNRELEEDLKREQQWLEEQERVVNALKRIEEEIKTRVAEFSKKSIIWKNESFYELQNKMLKLKKFEKELLNALSGFLEEHFPLPKKGGIVENKASIKIKAERQALLSLNSMVRKVSMEQAACPPCGFLKNFSEDPADLIKLHEIIEILINKSMDTPHEPYVTISDSFWTPYIELLLRYGVALRHPEDPKRIRLEAFHV